MSVRSTVFRIAVLLLVGAVIGGVLGAIFTGDWIYTIVWCVALTLVLVAVPMFISRAARNRVLTAPGRVPGIINSQQHQPAPAEAVLNPPPTAIPSTGATLNGVPVGVRPVIQRGTAIALILVGIALTLIPSYRLIGWTAGNIAQGRWDGNDMRTGLHQQEAVDDLAAFIGGYDFVAVSFYDSYVLVEAPTYVGATTTDQYEWRYGRASRLGPYSGVIDGLFDASQIDFSVIGDLVNEVKVDTSWTDFTYCYPAVRDNGEGQIEISISVANDYYSASYSFTSEGQFIEKYGTGLD